MKVDPEQLHDYANQLSRNAFALEDLTGYINAHCNRVDGMTGVLIPTAIAAMFNAGLMTDLARAGSRNLQQLTGVLHEAADDYRGKDNESAERIIKGYDGSWERLPEGYTETDTGSNPAAEWSDYQDVAAVNLPVPGEYSEFKPKIEDAKDNLKVIETEIKKLFGFSFAEDLLGPLFGNWDILRSNAEGFRHLAADAGIPVIRKNILHGMDSLSPTWDGEGATSFDFTIRQSWAGFIEFFGHNCAFQGAVWEATAQEALTVFDLLVFFIADVASYIPEKGRRVNTALHALDFVTAKEELKEILAMYLDFIDLGEDILYLVADILNLWAERIKTLQTQLQLLLDVVDGKARIPTTR